MSDIVARLDALKERLNDETFLSNKGLSNEVGLYIFAYRPSEEMAIRYYVQTSLTTMISPLWRWLYITKSGNLWQNKPKYPAQKSPN